MPTHQTDPQSKGPTARRLASLLLVLTLLGTPLAAAEIGVWEPVGPKSGRVDTLAADPADPSRLYAAQRNLLVRSADAGASWSPSLDATPFWMADIAVAPSDPDVLYAGTSNGSIFRSPDGGTTWAPRAPTPNRFPTEGLTVDPANADRVLANGGAGTVLYTTDGAATWSHTGLEGSIPFVLAFAFDPVQTSTVYATTPRQLHRSLDGGATWTKVAETPVEFSDLAAHPSKPGVLFAATHRGVERSADGGASWTRLGGDPAPGLCRRVAVEPAVGDVLLASCDGSLWRSPNGGVTWRIDPAPLTDTAIDEIEAVGDEPGALYLLSATSGIVASFDGGATWDLRTPRLGAVVESRRLLAPASGRSQVLAGTLEGLFLADHPAARWRFAVSLGATGVGDLAAERSSGRLFAASGRGLLASGDGGATWAEIGPEGPSSLVVVDPLHPGTLYAWDAVTGFSRTTDGGATWARRGHFENDCLTSVAAHPAMADTFFAGSRCCFSGVDCGGILATSDGWLTRERIRDRDGFDIAFSPPATLFVGDFEGVFRSTDLGETWELVSDEVETYLVGAVLVDPLDPRVVFAGVRPDPLAEPGGAKVIVSEDGGETWTRLDEGLRDATADGLPGASITDLAIDPRRPEYVYAATAGHGVYRLQRREVPAVPEPPPGDWLESAELPGFRVKVRIASPSGGTPAVREEAVCIPETLCVSGAVPGRSEVFVRVVGPKPNGHLWPTLVKFTTSTVEVWLEQQPSGVRRYYRLEGASPGVDELPGLFDRTGFLP